MLLDYLKVGTTEIANSARLATYMAALGGGIFDSADLCRCDTLTAEVLGDEPYTTPDDPANPAPWYDAAVPDSAGFLGLLVLDVTGIDNYPLSRTVTPSVSGRGAISAPRTNPRTMTFKVLLIGTSCCAVEYGLHWLGEAFQGCSSCVSCSGDCLSMYQCCPDEGLTAAQYNARYSRQFRGVALTDGPDVVDRTGASSCGGACGSGAPVLTVEFTVVAASPWAWSEPTPIVDLDLPRGDDECVTWCVSGDDSTDVGDECNDVCRFAECYDTGSPCVDDERCAPDESAPTVTAPETCFCYPLGVESTCMNIDLSTRPDWTPDFPVIVLRSGQADLRDVRVVIYERTAAQALLTPDQVADLNRCNPYMEFNVTYVAPGSSITLDGRDGRAALECGGVCRSSGYVYGTNGGPPVFRAMTCSTFVMCVETSIVDPPAVDASMTFSVTGRGY